MNRERGTGKGERSPDTGANVSPFPVPLSRYYRILARTRKSTMSLIQVQSSS